MKTQGLIRVVRERVLKIGVLWFAASTYPVGAAVVWDLKQEWSDTANPNGVWSLKEGNNLIPALESGWQVLEGWSEPQPGFAEAATGNQRIPFWFRSNGAETFSPDTLEGDIVVHTTDETSGTGNGPASVVWTSPISGTISILGGVWMTRDIGRANDWKLYHNASLFRNGALSSGDAYNRACPFRFENGTSPGAPGPFNMTVSVGDEIKLEIVRNGQFGDFVGVDFRIVAGFVWNSGTGANNHIYLPVKVPAGITWQEAEAAAVAAGGHLVSIGSAEEHAFVLSLVSGDAGYWLPNGVGPWLGGQQTPLGAEPAGGWQWSDGRGFAYTNWSAGRPDNAGGTEDRTAFFTPPGPAATGWDDLPAAPIAANRPRGYIIELLPQSGSSTKWTTGPGANGHSYQAILVPDGITWPEAEADAVARGGHLASINSAEENAFVFALVGSRPEYWYLNAFNCQIGPFIGCQQPDGSPEPGGGWQWTDGTPFTYTRWAGGEPNNSGNLERYAHFFNCGGPPASFWNDVSPSVIALGYIVEYGTDPDQPQGPEFADMLYIAAQGSNVVLQYRIAPTGTPALVRSLTDGMNKPSGLTHDETDALFVVQRGQQGAGDAKISRWLSAKDAPASAGFLSATPALDHAHGAAMRGEELLVVDSQHDQVRRFLRDAVGVHGEQLPVISIPSAGGLARYVAVRPGTGEVFVTIAAAGSGSKVLRFLLSANGTATANGEITGNSLSGAHGLTFSPWGELFVANFNGNTVSRFTLDAAGTAAANGTITGNGLNIPLDVAFSPWGELFVTNYNNGTVSRFKFDAAGAAQANGTLSTPGANLTALQFVSASAPEVPPPCIPGTTTSVSEGLIGWWKGDGDALDATGNHPGTAENAVTYAPGRFGQAFSLGSDPPAANSPRINLGHLPELKNADAWTISTWIKVPAISPGLFWLGLPVGNIAPGSGAPYYGRGLWAAASAAPGSFHPQFFQFSHNINYSATVPPFPAETWTHAVGVWRSEDGFQATYINGVLTNSGSVTPGAKFPDGSGDLIPAYIGALGFVTGATTTVNTSYPCLFDDVRIYDRALTAGEIALIASGQDFNTCAPSDTGHPPLTATQVPAGIKVSWPSRYTGWSLESSSELQTWAPVPGTPLLESGEFTVTTPLSGPRHSFRLRRQP